MFSLPQRQASAMKERPSSGSPMAEMESWGLDGVCGLQSEPLKLPWVVAFRGQ